jgi:hypothetical protein
VSESKAKAKAYKVGDVLEGVETVARPGGTETRVTGGLYVLDVPGVYLVNGQEVEAK